ncbi:MAG: hypothetical protein IKS48_13305 [Eubacterium sp.]|nr:hypothetical protein [Eubacterium sp.]
MELTSVGFYKEMPHGGDSELSILDFVDKAKDNIYKIVKYLIDGKALIISPGLVDDVIDSSKGPAGTPTVYTDGKWIWPGDLAYYVKNYHLELPQDFLDYMKEKNWTVDFSLDDMDFDSVMIDGQHVEM